MYRRILTQKQNSCKSKTVKQPSSLTFEILADLPVMLNGVHSLICLRSVLQFGLQLHATFTVLIILNLLFFVSYYRGADKSLARPGRAKTTATKL